MAASRQPIWRRPSRDETGSSPSPSPQYLLGFPSSPSEIAGISATGAQDSLVDGAQSTLAHPGRLSAAIQSDYFCFSGHKMLGPTGTGRLWMRQLISNLLHVRHKVSTKRVVNGYPQLVVKS